MSAAPSKSTPRPGLLERSLTAVAEMAFGNVQVHVPDFSSARPRQDRSQAQLYRSALVEADHLASCSLQLLESMNRHFVAVQKLEAARKSGGARVIAEAEEALSAEERAIIEFSRGVRSAVYEYNKRAVRARRHEQADDRAGEHAGEPPSDDRQQAEAPASAAPSPAPRPRAKP